MYGVTDGVTAGTAKLHVNAPVALVVQGEVVSVRAEPPKVAVTVVPLVTPKFAPVTDTLVATRPEVTLGVAVAAGSAVTWNDVDAVSPDADTAIV